MKKNEPPSSKKVATQTDGGGSPKISAAGKTERFVNGLARGPMMFQIMVNRVVELLDATVLPNEYDDDPEAEAAFDAALKRGPRPRR